MVRDGGRRRGHVAEETRVVRVEAARGAGHAARAEAADEAPVMGPGESEGRRGGRQRR